MNIENIKKIKNLNDYKRVPICKEIYSDFITPIEAMRILKSKSVNAFLLESVEDRKVWGRYTFLCYEPILEINASKWNINIKDKNGLKTIKGNPKDIIRKILKEYISLLKTSYDILYRDAEKEYDISKMVSCGIDDKNFMEEDFKAIRGTVEDNAFVIQYKKDMNSKINDINKIIDLL